MLDRRRPITDEDVPDADIVIATWWETAEWVNALGASKGAKVYFVQHHEIFPYLPVERCHATYRMPLHKIVIAPWLKRVMREQYGDDTVDLVPNSVERDLFFAPVRAKQQVPTVGLLYSETPFKGVDGAIKALQKVRGRIPEMRILSFGVNPPTPVMPLPENTEFVTAPPQEQLRTLYSQCDVWLTASRSEGFNLPALEAMACRTPVVSTKVGWPLDAIKTGVNGVLVSVDDVDEIARAVEWVLQRDSADWQELSSNAYVTSTFGSWQQSARMFEQALLHACRRAARGEIGGQCAADSPSVAPGVAAPHGSP
jgi:glycosyltransferase involved in cell wall biosynthesis